MARPLKKGIDYWPFDTGTFNNRIYRLIRSDFGLAGENIAIRLVNAVYDTNGYYTNWNMDDCSLMATDVGELSGKEIKRILDGCLNRELFDADLYKKFSVLTSKDIQRCYLRAVGNNRTSIQIIKEYWLLDSDENEEIPKKTLSKICFKSINSTENEVISTDNKVIHTENPVFHTDNTNKAKQSKANKNKLKQSKTNGKLSSAATAAFCRSVETTCTEILGRDITNNDRQHIANLSLRCTNAELINNIMRKVSERKKGSKINAFNYFMPAINEALTMSAAREKPPSKNDFEGRYSETSDTAEIEQILDDETNALLSRTSSGVYNYDD